MRERKKLARRWARNASLGIVGMLCLAACATPPPPPLTRIQVERAIVPAALLGVQAVPAVPKSRMQSAAADYLLRLKLNDDECHLNLDAIAATQR
jgi:hypothetical protein